MSDPLREQESVIEFTLRAVVAGIVLGALFGAANAYLGLKVGLTVATSIPIAVLTVAAFRFLPSKRGNTLLEANLSQTIGSASSSLASGTIFTIPALVLWGFAPPHWQVAMLAFCGAVLGICAMVPLRRLLIVKSHDELPYPEGTACAEVLKATTTEKGGAGRWIFIGLAAGAAIKLLSSVLMLFKPELSAHLPVLPKADLALEVAPALLAVGFILGFRQASIMVAGSLISATALTPLIALVGDGLTGPFFPEITKPISAMSAGEIWGKYVRYIGAGAVAAAGIVTVVRSVPTMARSLSAVVSGMKKRGVGGEAEIDTPRTDRDIPGWVVLAGPIAVVALLFLVPGLLAGNMSVFPRFLAALGVGVFGLLFVVVSSRIVGLIGVSSNPTSGMTLVTLLAVASIFVAFGWTDAAARAAILTVGTVVCVAASKAGDISQDLKTGFLVGATPARQQLGQFIAAAVACWVIALAVLSLGETYGFGSADLPAPQAMLMKTVVEGVVSGSLPWGLVGTGATFSLSAMLAGLPGLTFAIGIYLPLASMTPIFVGGLVRRLVDSRQKNDAAEGNVGVLAASGLIAGEALVGLAVVGVVRIKDQWPGSGLTSWLKDMHFVEKGFTHLSGGASTLVGVLLILAVCALLYQAGRTSQNENSSS